MTALALSPRGVGPRTTKETRRATKRYKLLLKLEKTKPKRGNDLEEEGGGKEEREQGTSETERRYPKGSTQHVSSIN